jgi:hypothetical protein
MNWYLSNKRMKTAPQTNSDDNGTQMSVKKSIQVAVRVNHEQLAWIDGEVARLQEIFPEANRSNVLRSLVLAAMKKQEKPSKQPTPKPTRGK